MHTVKVVFEKNGKIYHFASMAYYCEGSRLDVMTHEGYKSVTSVGCQVGLSDKATKWKSGGSVYQAQRNKYGTCAPEPVSCISDEFKAACKVLQRVQALPHVQRLALNTNGTVSYMIKGGFPVTSVAVCGCFDDLLDPHKSKRMLLREEIALMQDKLVSMTKSLLKLEN